MILVDRDGIVRWSKQEFKSQKGATQAICPFHTASNCGGKRRAKKKIYCSSVFEPIDSIRLFSIRERERERERERRKERDKEKINKERKKERNRKKEKRKKKERK